MTKAAVLIFPTTLLMTVGACSGPIATHADMSGAAFASGKTLRIAEAAIEPTAIENQARQMLATELTRQGYVIDEKATTVLEIALSQRSAPVGLSDLKGGAVSPSKQERLLQDCIDTTHRLALAVYEEKRPDVTRAWAEEHHCHGTLEQSLPSLVKQAVAVLDDPVKSGQTIRAGRD